MTGAHAYLDSTDLVDLRTLFNEGVHKSDVLVILATKGVFTRSWWCAPLQASRPAIRRRHTGSHGRASTLACAAVRAVAA